MEIDDGCAAIVFSEGGVVQFKAAMPKPESCVDGMVPVTGHVLTAAAFYVYMAEHHEEICANAPSLPDLLAKIRKLASGRLPGQPKWN